MNARSLVAARCRAWFRRGSGAGALTGMVVTLIALAAVALSAVLTYDWATSAAEDVERVRNHLFWLSVLETLIFAYTTFEVSFRSDDRRFIGLLPISGSTRWLELSARNLLVHLPLLVPCAGYAYGLFSAGAHDLAAYAAALLTGTYALGIPLSGWLHLKAGLSLLTPPGSGRRMLAGATVPAEAALLLYTPALGLAGTLFGVLVMDGTLRAALLRSDGSLGDTALGVLVVSGVLGAALVRRASTEAAGTLHRVAARFAEVDVPGPYRDDGLPERCPGLGWGRLLAPEARSFFERDLKQLKRRFRLDRILLWFACLWALRVGWVVTEPRDALRELWWLGALTTLLACHGPLATEGRELGSRWLRSALPNRLAPRALGSWLAFQSSAIWVWLWSAIAMSMVAGGIEGALLLSYGLLLCSIVWLCTYGVGRMASPERLRGYGMVWTAASVVAVSFVAGRIT